MAELREELVERFVSHLRELGRSCSGGDWLQLELTTAQLKALFALSMAQPCTIGELAQRLGVGLPAASHIAERLVRLGLIERYEDTADRRRAYARLTAEGDALMVRLQEGSRERIRERLDRLSNAELEQLDELMGIVAPLSPATALATAGESRRH